MNRAAKSRFGLMEADEPPRNLFGLGWDSGIETILGACRGLRQNGEHSIQL
jgi:hypothetical protein